MALHLSPSWRRPSRIAVVIPILASAALAGIRVHPASAGPNAETNVFMRSRRTRIRPNLSCVLLFVCLLCALEATPQSANAGGNAGGWLFLHSEVSVQYTTDGSMCDSLDIPALCDHQTTAPDSTSIVFAVFAGFPGEADLKGVVFGWEYDTSVTIEDYGPCGDFELADEFWPATATGTAITWASAQVDSVVPVYWGVAYADASSVIDLIPHPIHGAYFADSATPSNLDPIVCLGSLGFDTEGTPCCTPAATNEATSKGFAPMVFPNPARDFVRFAPLVETGTPVDLLNAEGSVNRRMYVEDGGVDIHGISPGVYWLRLVNNGGSSAVHKIVIAK